MRALAASGGACCTCLLLHVWHSGVTPHLRALLAEERTTKVGVNIGGDVGKLDLDYKMQVGCGGVGASGIPPMRPVRLLCAVAAGTRGQKHLRQGAGRWHACS